MMVENEELDTRALDLDADLEPRSRPRSCTWPPPCPEDFPPAGELDGAPCPLIKTEVELGQSCRSGRKNVNAVEVKRQAGGAQLSCLTGAALDVTGQLRKAKSSRRNAWGNLSYADLITRAIESTPEKRLTLSQIYDWMVRFVPYFKDKGDSNSSAGWKNSIRHNLSLHTRFIRVQNEGTGKSSWWMLNPEGSKAGKAPRRRAVSMDNSAKYLKCKGRVNRKKVIGRAVMSTVGQGFHGSPEQTSPTGKPVIGTTGVGEEFEAWTDLHSRTSSAASTLSLSPIMAEEELENPEDGRLSCSTSPHIYASPSSTRSPVAHCPPVELPRLADLTRAITLEEGYHHQQPPCKKHSAYHYSSGSKVQSSYSSQAYGQSGMGMLCHQTPLQTIQENKASSFSGSTQTYSSVTTLQSLLTGGSQYCAKDMMIGQEHEPMMVPSSTRVGNCHSHNSGHTHSNPHDHNSAHSHNSTHSLNQSHSHGSGSSIANNSTHSHSLSHNMSHNLGQNHQPQSHAGHAQPITGHMHSYSHKAPYLYSPPANAHLPGSTTLPPNPAGMQGISQDSCHLATAPHPHPRYSATYPGPHQQAMSDGPYLQAQGMGGGGGGGSVYQGYQHSHHNYPHERLPADLDLDIFHGSLDCDVESVLLHDMMDSAEEMDFNFDCSLAQGMGVGMGMGMSMGLTGAQQSHSNQSWVPG